MPFYPNQLADFAEHEVREFVKHHPDENFYGFAIDASLLCFNSIERFEAVLAEYRVRWPGKYLDDASVTELKMNTGDWEYQGFSDFRGQRGWDEDLYAVHYEIGFEDETSPLLAKTDYAVAMRAVLEELKKRRAFAPVTTTDDFWVGSVEHGY